MLAITFYGEGALVHGQSPGAVRCDDDMRLAQPSAAPQEVCSANLFWLHRAQCCTCTGGYPDEIPRGTRHLREAGKRFVHQRGAADPTRGLGAVPAPTGRVEGSRTLLERCRGRCTGADPAGSSEGCRHASDAGTGRRRPSTPPHFPRRATPTVATGSESRPLAVRAACATS